MSDQTTEAAIDTSEPSMEDILASIRKIIADDDTPGDVLSGDVPALGDIGNISELLSAEDNTVADNADSDIDKTIDPGVGHFAPDADVATADVSAFEATSELVSSELVSDVDAPLGLDDILTDTATNAASHAASDGDMVDLELDIPLDSFIDDTSLDGMVDFDLDAELSDFVELEIPEPETPEPETPEPMRSESVTPALEAGQDIADEIITRPGMASGVAQTITGAVSGVAATGAGAALIGAISGADKAPQADEHLVDEVFTDEGLTDIDAELSSLLDTTLTLDEDENLTGLIDTPVDVDVEAAIVDLALTDILPDNLPDNLTDEMNLDSNLGSETDAIEPDIEAQENVFEGAVSDQELDALLNGINTDADSDNAIALSDQMSSEEDADLVLVKSLMADLTDYDSKADEDFGEDNNNNLSLDAFTNDAVDATAGAELLSEIPDDIYALNDFDSDDESVLDEILDMTIEEELQSAGDVSNSGLDATGNASLNDMAIENAGDVAAIELENIAQNAELDNADMESLLSDVMPSEDSSDVGVNTAPEKLSLSDIAAAARADADAADSLIAAEDVGLKDVGLGAVLTGAGAVAAVAMQGDDVTNSTLDSLTQFVETDFTEDRADSESEASKDDIEEMLSRLLDSETDEAASTDITPEDEVFDLEGFAGSPQTAEEFENIEENLTPLHAEEATSASESLNQIETTEETTDMARTAAKNTDVIMDDVTEIATSSVFAQLNQVVEEKAIVAERGDRVGDLVMEALRPMLKNWLDANLKGIVERAVTKEVKRISSGK